MQNLKFNIQYSIFNIRYSILILSSILFFPAVLFAQIDAGPDVKINPGVPVTFTAKYGLVATEVSLTDNGVSPFENIGFPFNFFGQTYSQFSIGADGWVSFFYNPYWGASRNIRIPSSAPTSPLGCILGSMEDYNPEYGGGPFVFYRMLGEAPNRQLVVMWCQCPMMGCADLSVTFQIVLNENDNSIENHILNKPACVNWDNKATLGIQNENGTKGFAIPGKNAISWSVTPDKPKGYRYIPTSQDTYDIDSVPFSLVPITPGNKIIYSWYEGSSTESFSNDSTVVVTPNETTTYIVTAVLCGGATFADTVTVTVVPKIPDAFTPNDDGLNDKFEIIGLPVESITRYNLKIYNRWGQMIFTSGNIDESWDGTMNNNGVDKCPDGSYAWVIYYENANKTKVTNKGSVILLR